MKRCKTRKARHRDGAGKGGTLAKVAEAVDTINAGITVPCTGCAYCVEGCPQKVPFPRYFSLYNTDLQESGRTGWKPQGEYYRRLAAVFGKADNCIGCGKCQNVCPQHLPIIDCLKDVESYFGE